MNKSKRVLGFSAAMLLLISGVTATGAQAASALSICKAKSTGALSVKAKCAKSEVKVAKFSELVGAKGATGAAGAKGETGAAGAAGTNGTNGTNGEPGAKGETGAAGAPGEKGDKGDKGDAGADAVLPGIGDPCSVEISGTPTAGVYALVETTTGSAIYVMGCDTN